MPAAPKPLSPPPDPRIVRLESFFHRYHCPAPLYVADYLQKADKYGLDYRVLPAISIRETHCGLAESGNNRWGFRNGAVNFASIEAGIDFMTHRIAEHPYYRGESLPRKLFTYNPRASYPQEVLRIMRQIDGTQPDVE
jgi:hypothetical protein